MSNINEEPFPRAALIGVGALLGLALISTAATRVIRLSAPMPTPAVQPAPAATVDLQFTDQADGSISVRNSRSGQAVARLAPDSNGFVRGVMRGLARDRISRGIGEAPPFRISQDHEGRLSLQDTATHRLIDLEAFGSSNRDDFLALLKASGARS